MVNSTVSRVRLQADLVSLLLDYGHDGHDGLGNDDCELGSGYKKCMQHGRKALFKAVESSEKSVEPSTVEES